MRSVALAALFLFASTLAAAAERTHGDVARAVDKHKGGFYALYSRALRDNPRLRGKILVTFSIAPDGKASGCSVVSSTLGDKTLENKLAQRFCTIDYGAKGVSTYEEPGYELSFFAAPGL